MAIHKALTTKGLSLSLHKVKAHSGAELNELADKLAKERAQREKKINLTSIVNKDAIYRFSFRSISIEYPIRAFFKKILAGQVEAKWASPSNKINIEKNENRD